jgi:hypothetical protein
MVVDAESTQVMPSRGAAVQRGRAILLESNDCFAIDSGAIGQEHFRNMKSLAYELEQFIPLDAERMVLAVAGNNRKKGRGLVLVADRDWLQSQVDELEQAGEWIALITPKFLFEAQHWCISQSVKKGILIRENDSLNAWDFLRVKDSEPVQWLWFGFKDLLLELSNLPPETEVTVLGGADKDSIQALQETGCRVAQPAVSLSEVNPISDARLDAMGPREPWFDFRVDGVRTLYRKAPYYGGAIALSGAMLLMLLASIAVLWIRCSDLRQTIAESDAVRSQKFAQLFPTQNEPVDVPGRLQSELRKLEMTKTELNKEPPVYSSLPLLVHFLNALPVDAVFRIDAIRLKSKQLSSVEGSVRTLTDFEALMGALRADGFEFAQPNLNQMKDGFSLRLERMNYVPKTQTKEMVK